MTYTDICNLALGALGHDRTVDDYDGKDSGGSYLDRSSEAVRCRLFLPVALEQTLGRHDWNWCAREVPVSLEGGLPGGWCRLERPSGALNVVGVFLRGNPETKVETKAADGCLWARPAHGRPAFLRYVPSAVSPDEMPWWFRDALVHALAAKLAGPMFGDDAKTANFVQLSDRSLSAAVCRDDSESARAGRARNPYLEARI